MRDVMKKPELFAKIQALLETGGAESNDPDFPCSPEYGNAVHEYYGLPGTWEISIRVGRASDRALASRPFKLLYAIGAFKRLSMCEYTKDLIECRTE